MSKMSNLIIEINELYHNDFSVQEIADKLDISEDMVCSALDIDDECSYNDDMDGDAESAFTSIGWGTDESYGYYEYM